MSPQERETCAEVVAMKIVLVSQRAQALLLICDGETQAETVRKTGLTIGQVRYAITRFKNSGLAMFPPVAAQEAEIEPPALTQPQTKKKKTKDKKKKSLKKATKPKKDKKKSESSAKKNTKKKKSKKAGKKKKKK